VTRNLLPGVDRAPMATLDGLLDKVWRGVGAECREHVAEVLRFLNSAREENRHKLLACFFWVNWVRGQADARAGKERFWDLPA